MPGRNRSAASGEARCGVERCSRPAGLGTEHAGDGPCLRHEDRHRSHASHPATREPVPETPPPPLRVREGPPEWRTADGEPWPDLRAALDGARRDGKPFAVAWVDGLLFTLDGLSRKEFDAWAEVLLATAGAWADAYDRRRSRIAGFSV